MVGEPPLNGLPPAGTRRWVARRKAAVVAAVRQGVISREEACRRYELSEEELSSWQRSFEAYGINGLRVTQLAQYRDASSSRLAIAAPRAAVAARKGSGTPVEGLPRTPAGELPVSGGV
jgi:transposase-like protein